MLKMSPFVRLLWVNFCLAPFFSRVIILPLLAHWVVPFSVPLFWFFFRDSRTTTKYSKWHFPAEESLDFHLGGFLAFAENPVICTIKHRLPHPGSGKQHRRILQRSFRVAVKVSPVFAVQEHPPKPPFCQKRSGDPNPQYFSKSTAVQMGGVLPYEWEAYCS